MPPLSKALLQDADEQVRSSAAIALGQLGQVQATACLLDALEDGSESVRKNAFEAVQNLVPEESLTFYPGAKEEIRKYLTGKLREWWAQRSSPK